MHGHSIAEAAAKCPLLAAYSRPYSTQNPTARRTTLARHLHLDYCISKQHTVKAPTVDPLDIEDDSDWLGCPTELETISHYNRMLENEIQELTLQQRKAREDIFGLVQMHADASKERDRLRAELSRTQAELSDTKRDKTSIEIKSNWQLAAKDRLISELYAKIVEFTGIEPYTRLPGN